jgi:hypothetical protein
MTLIEASRAGASVVLGLSSLAGSLPAAAPHTAPIPITPIHIQPAMAAAPPRTETPETVAIGVETVRTDPVTIHIPDNIQSQDHPASGDFEDLLRTATIAAFGEAEWPPMRTVVMMESGMNPYAVNKSSGACSAFQFLPCAKLGGPMSDFANQIAKGIAYVQNRYGTPSAALAFHYAHGWY